MWSLTCSLTRIEDFQQNFYLQDLHQLKLKTTWNLMKCYSLQTFLAWECLLIVSSNPLIQRSLSSESRAYNKENLLIKMELTVILQSQEKNTDTFKKIFRKINELVIIICFHFVDKKVATVPTIIVVQSLTM